MDRKTISFISTPGGTGKTTLISILAWFLAERGIKSLLVDLDPRGGLTLKFLDYKDMHSFEETHKTIADLLQKAHKTSIETANFPKYLQRAHYKDVLLHLIPSSLQLADTIEEIWHSPSLRPSEFLRETLQWIPEKEKYEYILLDTPPLYELKYAFLIYLASDLCTVPLKPVTDQLGLNMQFLNKLKRSLKEKFSQEKFEEKLHFVFNKVPFFRRETFQSYKSEIMKIFPYATVFQNVIQNSVAFQRINTKEEKPRDNRKVREYFEPFYREFMETIKTSTHGYVTFNK